MNRKLSKVSASILAIIITALVLPTFTWSGDKENLILEKKARIEAQFETVQAKIQVLIANSGLNVETQKLQSEYASVKAEWEKLGGKIDEKNNWTMPSKDKPIPEKGK